MKNIKLLFLSSFLLTGFTSLFAQNLEVDWGVPQKKEGGIFTKFHLVDIVDDHYYVMMSPRKSNTLLKYSMNNHKLVSNQAIDFEHEGKRVLLDQFIHTTSGTFGFFTPKSRMKKNQAVITSRFDKGKFEKISLVYKHQPKSANSIATANKSYKEGGIFASKDSSHVAFVDIHTSNMRGSATSLAVAVFDENMERIWDKIQPLKFKNQTVDIVQKVVSSQGEVFLIAKLYDVSLKSFMPGNKDILDYDYKVFKITKDGFQDIDVKIGGGKAATDAGVFFPKNNSKDFILSGFYTDKTRKGRIVGTFIAKGNSESSTLSANTQKFEANFLTDLLTEKQIKKEKGLYNSFSIKDMVEFGDGSMAFIAEETYVTTNSVPSGNGRSSTSYSYSSNDIIIPRYSAEGELLNIQKVKKRYSSSAFLPSSYFLSLHQGNICLIYNNLKGRAERKAVKKSRDKSGKIGYFTDMTVISPEGEIILQETLFNKRDLDFMFYPQLSSYQGNTILVGAANAQGYRFGSLQMNK